MMGEFLPDITLKERSSAKGHTKFESYLAAVVTPEK